MENSYQLSKEWYDFARMDLNSAEYLRGMRPVPVEIICYHCEQAVEKLLKAVLVYHDIEAPKTHDLIQLCKLCTSIDVEFEALADSCVELTPYGVQARYPSNMELDEQDMSCAIREANTVCSFITQRLVFEPREDMGAPKG